MSSPQQSDLSSWIPRKGRKELPKVLSDEQLAQIESVLENTNYNAHLVETEFLIQ